MSYFYKLHMSIRTVETITFWFIWIANEMATDCLGV
jgi:hypothetical protein